MLRVIDGGLQTTVQDVGRFGWYRIGMPPSGAMDQFALRVGNMLVGNAQDAAGLEITYVGPELEFGRDALIALTGAELSARLNGAAVPMWTALGVSKGDRISCGRVTRGARSYLCVGGGIDVRPLLGSRSTYLLGRFGGHAGRRLEAQDRLPLGRAPAGAEALLGRQIDASLIPRPAAEADLRIVMGLCSYRLIPESVSEFLSAKWEVTTESNRVGYRLHGPPFRFVDREPPFGAGSDPSNVVDVGYPVGSIQIPGGLEAILLMRDAVTGGGYATIGTVIQCDLDRVAQASPGTKVTFQSIDIDEAIRLRADYKAHLRRVALCLSLLDLHGHLGQ